MYLFLNGSAYNFLYGSLKLVQFILALIVNRQQGGEDPFWLFIAGGGVLLGLYFVLMWLWRKFKLAVTKTDMPQLTLRTIGMIALTIGIVAIVGRIGSVEWTANNLWRAFTWSWQIPVGYFLAEGLSWNFVDRQVGAVVTTDERRGDDAHHGHHDQGDATNHHQNWWTSLPSWTQHSAGRDNKGAPPGALFRA
jgi:uncharacterized protein YjeT (DUF2065 family)